jgi:phage protein D
VTAKKKECHAAAQAKQVVGTGKRKRSSNKSHPAPAKQRHADPSPDMVPIASSVDRQQADNAFASKKQKVAVNSLLASISA